MKDIHDVIKHVKFGDDRLRGSGVVAGQISAFPIDFAGRPYNTLTLPCERVISVLELWWPSVNSVNYSAVRARAMLRWPWHSRCGLPRVVQLMNALRRVPGSSLPYAGRGRKPPA